MKKIIFILLTIMAVGCSKNSTEPESDDVVFTDGFDKNGIRSNINDQEFTFDRYHTKIEIFPAKVYASPFVEVLYNDGDNISVTWKYNDSDVSNIKESEKWNSEKQKWTSFNKPALGDDKLFDFGDKIKASVRFSDGKTINIENSIKENEIVRDVLGVNFGMTKENVFKNELERVKKSECKEYQPNTLLLSHSTNIERGVTIYRFKDNKLIEVGEYTKELGTYNQDTGVRVLNKFVVDYCKRIGLKEEPAVDENGNLVKDYIWSNKDITFTLSMITDIPGSSPRSSKSESPALGVSYKLK